VLRVHYLDFLLLFFFFFLFSSSFIPFQRNSRGWFRKEIFLTLRDFFFVSFDVCCRSGLFFNLSFSVLSRLFLMLRIESFFRVSLFCDDSSRTFLFVGMDLADADSNKHIRLKATFLKKVSPISNLMLWRHDNINESSVSLFGVLSFDLAGFL